MAEGDRGDDKTSDREVVTGEERAELDETPSDPDRAAILARRQRFIAVALSGLAGAGACDRAFPQPCLSPQPTATATAVTTSSSQVAEGTSSVAPPAPAAEPQPCLDVRIPSDDAAAPAASSPPPAAPRPCLKVAPKPPEPAPRPCLMVLREEDGGASDSREK